MHCLQCHTDNPESAKFCLECGARLALLCPECATPLPAGAKFCLECGARLTAGPAPEPPSGTIPERIRRLMPQEYVEQLLAAGGQMAGERRLVTILFSDVKGSTAMAEKLDPEDVMEIMNGAFDVLIEPIMKHEGTLARLMGDAILAFFGAPMAHEDDPERACRAALEIVAGAREYAARLQEERGIEGFAVRVGINTGLVVVGEVGSDLRVEYTAMGDAINLAARMEQHAPMGGILITHDTYRHVRGIFDVEAQEPLIVKGKAEPVQTYIVLQAKPRAFRLPTRGVEGIETRMVGRDAELKRLQDALYDAIEDRERQMVTIVGEAGVGKSRLLYEFDDWLELLPETVRYFKGRARQEMQSIPYALLRDLFAFRFQIQDSDSAQTVREKMAAGVGEALGSGEQCEVRAHIIGQLIGYDFGGSEHLEKVQDDPKALHEQARAYLEEFFAASSELNPTVIFLEDLHWADDSSLDVLNHLAEALPQTRLLIVCAVRPALFERRPHWGEGQDFHRRMELEPLSKRESRALVLEILQRVRDVPSTLRDLIVIGAEGNPFFIEELVKMLVEDNVIVKGEEVWWVDPDRLTDVRVPESLTGVLQARLDRLPLEERTILQQASVVGRLFWDRAVAHIGESAREGLGELETANGLAALRNREMVFQRETSAFAATREYVFKHTLMREITYATVLKRLRRVYHGLVADWLIEESGERVAEMAGLIADHLEAAGRRDEAIERLQQVGDQARALYAQQEAIAAYQRALALQREQGAEDDAARTLMKLGLTYHNAFEFELAQEAFTEGFALWQRPSAAQMVASPAPAPHALRLECHSPSTLDPTQCSDTPSGLYVVQLFHGLVEEGPGTSVLPDIAHSWEMLDGGCKYVFYLRDDIRWSDGEPVCAADFAFAWKRVLNPETGASNANLLYDISGAQAYHQGFASDAERVGIRAADDLTLVVELEGPTAYFLHLLTQPVSFPVPRHVVERHGESWANMEHIVTNGPFRLERGEPGQVVLLSRNPGYSGRRQGNVERVQIVLHEATERPSIMDLYEADRLDVLRLDLLPLAEQENARQRHAGEYVALPGVGIFYVIFDTSCPPFDDVRVRQAVVMATDRECLAHVVLGGFDAPATGGFIPPGMPGHSVGIGLPYHPLEARRLLAQAGYPDGRGFPAVGLEVWDRRRAWGEYVAAQVRENLGVEILVDSVEWVAHFQRMRSGRPAAVVLAAWEADFPDPDAYLRVASLCENSGWRNETYDRLVEPARRIMDHGERMKMYRQADRILMDEAPIMPLTYSRDHLLVKPWVRGLSWHGSEVASWKDVVIESH